MVIQLAKNFLLLMKPGLSVMSQINVIYIFTALLSNLNFNTTSAYISKLHNQAHFLDRVW